MKKAILLSLTCLYLTACSISPIRSIETSKTDEHIGNIKEKNEMKVYFSSTDLKIISIGDSLTQGVGDYPKKTGYQPILEMYLENELKMEEINIVQYGKKGLTSSGLVGKIGSEKVLKLIKDADVVIITIGGNDVMSIAKKNYKHLQVSQFSEGINEYEKNVSTVLTSIREKNNKADIYLVGLYNPFRKWLNDIEEFDDIMIKWNERSEEISHAFDRVYFVEIANAFSKEKENPIYEEDFFHPNSKGYEIMGNAIYQQMKQNTISHVVEKRTKESK